MHFVHQPYQPGETIAAVATPPGEGGVAIIRISGNEALSVADRVLEKPASAYKSHTVRFGHVIDVNGKRIDDVLIIVMRAPRSYTGEDTIEIHCHGGSLITRRVLEVVLAAGARAARPGEFTFKAYINGKIDLAQAEAVQELISAKNEKALDAAEQQLQGRLSLKVNEYQQRMTLIAAILEAWVDFPDEGLEFATMDEICSDLENIVAEMQKMAESFHDGKIIHDGLSLCLIGRPNVGKSSLMNALLDKERAIVSHIPGTTRDLLEDHIRLNGLNLKVTDTAGIREASEIIEQEGIRRSKMAINQADLVVAVLDATQGLSDEDKSILEQIPDKKSIVVWNKMDLSHEPLPPLEHRHVVSISAKEKVGLDVLKAKIDEVIWEHGAPSKEEIVVTNVRHKESLEKAIEAARNVVDGLRTGVSPEFISMDMRQSLSQLGQIIGTNIPEDILSAIFSKFCIGK